MEGLPGAPGPHPAVVVLSVREYERLCRLEKASAPTFSELLL